MSGAAKTLLAGLWAQAEHLWKQHRRLAIGLIAAAVIAVFGAGVLAYELLKRPADVHNENATFVPQKPPKPEAKTVNWPMYGLNPARTRYLPATGIKPPFRKLWRFTEKPLLEFPPIYVGGKLYCVNNNGTAYALDADSGKVLWERSIGRLNASSPTYSKHRLYIVNLVPGHIVKLDAKTGKIIWKHSLPGRAESSPVVIGRTVYFGCEDGNLYALSTISGNVRWATALGGPVKSAPAYYGGTLYVGDYGGYMNAVDAKTGKLEWQTGSLGQGFGTSGQFYSTPAVAFGRVYAGNNDDRVYSFDLKDGTLAWSYSTGGYAYSGPTVSTTAPQPADRLHRLLRRQRLRDRRQGRQRALEPLGRRPGGRFALLDRRHRLRRRVHQQHDQRLHDEERPQGLQLPPRHLLAGGLRRPPHLPDRLLEHHRAAALQVQRSGRAGDRRPPGQARA